MRVAVAMSGGVDSSVAALLLHRRGIEVVGLSMHLYNLDLPDTHRFDTCCSLDDLQQARRVADRLGIPHYIVDYTVDFDAAVVRPFVAAYAAGETPNPCVWCNDRVKFQPLFEHARRLGCSHLATGHYARVVDGDGGPHLARAVDARKDQSYFLFSLRADQLARTIFPLGELTKDEVRRVAAAADLPTARKPESQDICFIPDGDLAGFLDGRVAATRPGEIVNEHGDTLGMHEGVHRYTVGQRRGLGVAAAAPLYVKEIRAYDARVVVAERPALFRRGARLRDVRWPALPPRRPLKVAAQVRYRSRPVAATIAPADDGWTLTFAPGVQEVVAPGQAAVFYDGERVLGGGWIAAAVDA